MLPLRLPEETINDLFTRVEANPGYTMTIDLEKKQLSGSDGFAAGFELDEDRRQFLLQGLDEIGLTLRYEAAITTYEKDRGITT
jgi:3-isopropylmalate/(R)-2-methylmalate dehydratase small subunit